MRYRIKALDPHGSVKQLAVEALDDSAARATVQAQGMAVLSLRRAGIRRPWAQSRPRIEPALFTQELVALLGAGLTVVDALDVLLERSAHGTSEVLRGLREGLHAGLALSHALERQGAAFPELLVATVRAAERSGNLVPALIRFHTYQLRVNEVQRQLRRAALYPAVLLAAGCAVGLFMLLFVVPRFSRIYDELGGALPWMTRALLDVSRAFSDNAVAATAIAVTCCAFAWHGWTRGRLRQAAGHCLVRVPFVGERWRLFELARFYRTLSMLLHSGITVPAALRLSQGLLGDGLRAGLERAIASIEVGLAPSLALSRQGLTTAASQRLLTVGERTGQLADLVERCAEFHELELTTVLDGAVRLIEPVLMILIGGLVGLIVVLLYLPIFDLAAAVT